VADFPIKSDFSAFLTNYQKFQLFPNHNSIIFQLLFNYFPIIPSQNHLNKFPVPS